MNKVYRVEVRSRVDPNDRIVLHGLSQSVTVAARKALQRAKVLSAKKFTGPMKLPEVVSVEDLGRSEF